MPPFSRRYLHHFDLLSFILIMSIASIGLLFVYSATYRLENPYSIFFKKQAVGIAMGLIIYIACSLIDFRSLMRLGYFAFIGVIGLLLFTIIKGHVGMGAQRWISLFFFKLQPSELTKILFPAFVTYYCYTNKDMPGKSLAEFTPILLTLAISAFLILKQPDLGTALLLLFSSMIMLWLMDISKKFFIYSLIFTIVSAPICWHFLKDYQKQRIAVFLGEGENRKERYQTEQAKIAIGSGGLTGKGFLQGTQNKLLFLPESRTDFIFAVLCEEWGFLGAFFILLLYGILFFRQFYVILELNSPFIQLLAIGLVIHIIFSTLINIAMVLGLLPIVGIPLPFMSYGLSNLWVNFASFGWLNSIIMRRYYVRN